MEQKLLDAWRVLLALLAEIPLLKIRHLQTSCLGLAHHQMDFSDVEKTYDAKLSVYSTAFKHKMTSDEYFADHSNGWYDFVYVDADHTAAAAYKDGVNGWRDLKPNGILAFDDYTWGDGLPDQTLAPRPGIDKFLDEFNGQYHLMHKGAQVWIRKNA